MALSVLRRLLPGLVLLVGALSAGAESQSGLLWKIEGGNVEPSYILGTIHSDDPRVVDIPQPVNDALAGANSFSAELKMDMMTLLEAQQIMMLGPEQQLSDMLSKARYEKVVGIMGNYGMPELLVNRMKPWAIALAMNMPAIKTPQVLDIVLYQRAQAQGKALYGLETPRQQVAGLESLSVEEQKQFLADAIRLYPHLQDTYEALLQTYLARDLHGFKRIEAKLEKHLRYPQLAQKLERSLVIERNHRMVENMQPRLKEGKAFIAVGAAHLPGEQGILQLLRDQGYQVSVVY